MWKVLNDWRLFVVLEMILIGAGVNAPPALAFIAGAVFGPLGFYTYGLYRDKNRFTHI